jgi:dipeptide/tripeptide permease
LFVCRDDISFDQQSNAWVLQAVRMRLDGIQPEQMQLANPVFVLLLIPVLERYVYPAIAAFGVRVTEFRRIGVGMLLTVAAYLLAAWVQSTIPEEGSGVGPSVFLQLPQFFLISLAECLISITGLEFAYTQAPAALKSLITACWLITTGLGNLLAGLLWDALGGSMSVTALNILFAALMLLNGIAFMHVAATFEQAPSQVGELKGKDDSQSGAEQRVRPAVAAGGRDERDGLQLSELHGVEAFNSEQVNHEIAHVGAIENA